MVRFGRAIARGVGQGLGPAKFQGIRFRLGLWLAIALLPLLILGAFQAESAFRAQDADRRSDLQLAAERSAANAKARSSNSANSCAASKSATWTISGLNRGRPLAS